MTKITVQKLINNNLTNFISLSWFWKVNGTSIDFPTNERKSDRPFQLIAVSVYNDMYRKVKGTSNFVVSNVGLD